MLDTQLAAILGFVFVQLSYVCFEPKLLDILTWFFASGLKNLNKIIDLLFDTKLN